MMCVNMSPLNTINQCYVFFHLFFTNLRFHAVNMKTAVYNMWHCKIPRRRSYQALSQYGLLVATAKPQYVQRSEHPPISKCRIK